MKLAHVALWCRDLDRAAAFWVTHFDATPGVRYESTRRPGFASCFVKFTDGAALELMTAPWLGDADPQPTERPGWAHLAISLGSAEEVDALATRLQTEGLLVSPPRHTGDGFYEAVIRDPEGDLVEITA